MDILEAIEKCTYSANIDGCATSVVDRDELISLIGINSSECKGANCSAVDGVGHSSECENEHDWCYS